MVFCKLSPFPPNFSIISVLPKATPVRRVQAKTTDLPAETGQNFSSHQAPVLPCPRTVLQPHGLQEPEAPRRVGEGLAGGPALMVPTLPKGGSTSAPLSQAGSSRAPASVGHLLFSTPLGFPHVCVSLLFVFWVFFSNMFY